MIAKEIKPNTSRPPAGPLIRWYESWSDCNLIYSGLRFYSHIMFILPDYVVAILVALLVYFGLNVSISWYLHAEVPELPCDNKLVRL